MTLFSILVKVTLILGGVVVAQMAFGRRLSASTRHLVWTVAIAVALLLPILAITLPAWSPVEYTKPAGFVPLIGIGSPEPPPLDAPAPMPDPQTGVAWPSFVAVVYVAVAVLLLVRVLLQHLWAYRLVSAATPITDTVWLELLEQCARKMGVHQRVRLLRTTVDTIPAAAGVWKASVLLPPVADTWSVDRRRAVLLHELAHVERHDCLTQAIASVTCAAYWVNPVVWWVAKQLQSEREAACDDRVLSAGENAREYAEHLLELAYALAHPDVPAMAVTMARPRELEGRMLAVLDTARNRAVPALRNQIVGMVALVGLTVPVAAVTLTPKFHILNVDELRGTRERLAQAGAATQERLEFDVVSIKRTPEDTGPGADFGILVGGTLHARSNQVSNFITHAYDVPYYALIGGPDWMRDENYDLEAKADRDRPRAEMMRMLQTLLADRFQFRAHRETRDLPAYVLTVARGGAKLTRSSDDECEPSDPSKPIAPPVPGATRRPSCGNNLLTTRGVAPNMMWSAVHIDMGGVVGTLAAYFRRPVVDRTGITGFYDVNLQLPPLQPDASDAGLYSGVSVFTVLQEQLGLRVEEGKGPVDVLVVDHLERPTGN